MASYVRPPTDVTKKKRWKKRPKPYNAPKLEDLETVLGRWKVTKVIYEEYLGRMSSDDDNEPEDGNREVTLQECEGVEVMFDDQCDITWYIPKTVDPITLFFTTSFNIERDSMDLIGGEDGKTFRFLLELRNYEKSQLVLKTPIDARYDEEVGEMIIMLDKVSNSSAVVIDNFSLGNALEEGFFSDLTVRSSDGVAFPVHRIVLSSNSPKLSYREWEVLLSGFKAPLVKVILEYLYTNSLPQNLSLSLAKELCTSTSSNPKLSDLHELAKAFIESNDLKQRLMGLVDDLQSSFLLAKRIVENTEASNPVKVTYTIKTLAKEAASGAAKLGLLCELYTRNKKDMTKKEKHELLEYVRGRVVVFIGLITELIQLGIEKFNSLTDAQKMEIALYVIPEVERIWDMINEVSKEVEAAMMDKVKSLYLKGRPHFRKKDIKLAFILQFISKGRELKRLVKIEEEFKDFVIHSQRKRDDFRDWTEVEKAEKIIRVMEGMEGEGMNQMEQLSNLKKDILMENALDWKRFKILVTVCCSYVSWGIRKVQGLKAPLNPLLLKGCKYLHKSEFNDALVYFDLLNQSDLEKLQDDNQDVVKVIMPGLKTVSLPNENLLSKGCQKLLTSLEYSDMQFIMVPNTSGGAPGGDDGSDGGNLSASGEGANADGSDKAAGKVIPAHRMIVAARCEYFSRALQSGMKEAIDKRIVIHGCDESLFRTFLYYLYGGVLDTTTMSLDDIIELLAIADRYETTSLLMLCESLLVDRVEDRSVFVLLQVADHYSARQLREVTLQHIIADPDILMTELEAYSNLPDYLKDEIRSILSSNNPYLALRHRSYNPGELQGSPELRTRSDTGSSSSSSKDSSNSSSGGGQNLSHSTELVDSFSQLLEDPYHSAEHLAFQEALKELKGIVGEDASDEVLKDILLAADMDINRAVNFYFS